jgi:hypothetical protein
MNHTVDIKDDANGARYHISNLSQKYTVTPLYKGRGRSNQNRLMYRIELDKVHGR